MSRSEAIEWRNWAANLPWHGRDWEDRVAFETASYRSIHEHLLAARRRGDLRVYDFPLICVLRNEVERLPVFLDHYRKLGITRFIMVDNQSDDGSHELLMSQDDVDLFVAHVPYMAGQGGIYWANGLAHALCEGHWTLRVDVDELLVYDRMDKHDLPALADWLQKQGRDRILAPMCDVYPSTPLEGANGDIARMLTQDCWFDREGYASEKWREGWHITGGPRERLFGQTHSIWLSKYPLFRMTSKITFLNTHYLWPFDRTLDPPRAALLHLKLLGDFIDRSKAYEYEGQHAMDSRAYRIANAIIGARGSLSPHHEGSVRYEGPQSLIAADIMLPIDWNT